MDYSQSFFALGEVARLTIAVIFAVAAFHAMREWSVFVDIVEQYHLVPRRLAMVAARILPPLQLSAAAALVMPKACDAGAVLGFCLMALFTGAVTVNLARGRASIDCGCGGAGGQKLSAGLVLRNVVVMCGLAVAFLTPPQGTTDSATTVGVIGASLAFIALYFAANQLMTNSQALNAMSSRGGS